MIRETRSSHNWQSRSGTWDSINTRYIDFETDFPELYLSDILEDFQTVNINDYKNINYNSCVLSFLDDYILERFWKHPIKYVAKFKDAKFVCSPDYSILLGMPKSLIHYNTYRNRLVGYLWAKNNINVIPTVSWASSSTFDIVFEGIKPGSCVAVSNIGMTDISRTYFDSGYNEMIKKIQPNKILFQCKKKYRNQYEDKSVIFVESFWDKKNKTQWEVGQGNQ